MSLGLCRLSSGMLNVTHSLTEPLTRMQETGAVPVLKLDHGAFRSLKASKTLQYFSAVQNYLRHDRLISSNKRWQLYGSSFLPFHLLQLLGLLHNSSVGVGLGCQRKLTTETVAVGMIAACQTAL